MGINIIFTKLVMIINQMTLLQWHQLSVRLRCDNKITHAKR
jgi:hypothetical protein